jgi:hypothetical protein
MAGPGFVSWRTKQSDGSGLLYPGPGTFGAHTSDYCVVSEREEQSVALPVKPSLTVPVGTVQGLWYFDGNLLDETSNSIDLSHAGTPYYRSSPAPGVSGTFINGQLITSPQSATSDPIRLTGAMTLECLINPSQIADPNGYICHFLNVGTGTANNSLWALRLSINNELDYFHEDVSEVGHTVSSQVFIAPGKWHHVAFTRDSAGTLIRLYVDGVLVRREVVTDPPSGGADSHIQIGQSETPDRRYFGGMDSIRITDAEFRPEHILASARETLPPELRP